MRKKYILLLSILFINPSFTSDDGFLIKEFSFFQEDINIINYTDHNPDVEYSDDEQKVKKVGENIIKRSEEIIRHINEGINKIRLDNLCDLDMYPVVKGISKRLISVQNKQINYLQYLDLSYSNFGTSGFITLYGGIMNSLSENGLHKNGLYIILPDFVQRDNKTVISSIKAARKNGIKFKFTDQM